MQNMYSAPHLSFNFCTCTNACFVPTHSIYLSMLHAVGSLPGNSTVCICPLTLAAQMWSVRQSSLTVYCQPHSIAHLLLQSCGLYSYNNNTGSYVPHTLYIPDGVMCKYRWVRSECGQTDRHTHTHSFTHLMLIPKKL